MLTPTRFVLIELTFVIGVIGGLLPSCLGKDNEALRLEKEIPLPGVEGRIDHFSVDSAGQRLFIAALGNGSIEIVDTKRAERLSEIKGLAEPQGLYYDSEAGHLYVATGEDGKLRVYEGKSLNLLQTLEFGNDADNVRRDPETGNIWVGYGSGGLGIINSAGQKVGSVVLNSHPEAFLFEESGDRIFANVPKQLGVSVIDRWKRAVIAKWGVGGTLANYPMALDDHNKRLFVGCRLPARLVILDTGTGRIVATLPTVGDTDDIFYDGAKQQIYVIGGDGAVEVFRQRDPDHYQSMGRTATGAGARTGLFVASSNRLYVAVPHRGPQAARVLVYLAD
jgi:DNA-binding beta-propeller fold protein YncE